jgi:hypothetical protein
VEGYSECHSYFRDYLKYVDVVAGSEEEALKIAKQKYGEEFVREDLTVYEIVTDLGNSIGVVHTHYGTDY